MSDNPQNYTGQTFTQPVYVDGNLLTNPQIRIAREPFLLEQHHFEKILNGSSFWSKMSELLIGSTIALLLNLSAKLVGNKIDATVPFDKWELYAFGISIFCMVVTLGMDKFYPSSKTKMINKIKQHFGDN